MFRRLPGSLPADPIFPRELKSLGFEINNKNQFRPLSQPTELFKFKITNNETWNEKHKDAVYGCVRNEIGARLVNSGLMDRVYLPHLTTTRPKLTEAHLPIFCSPPKILQNATRVVVLLQDSFENWLMWSRNTISADSGIEYGSPIGLANILKDQYSSVGLIVLNPCQLLYSYEEGEAMSTTGWKYRPGRNAVHSEREIVPEYNSIPRNETAAKHVEFVFEKLISDASWVNPAARLDIIGINNGGETILQFLHDNWEQYGHRLSAIALPNCPTSAIQADSLPFLDFLATRGRIWKHDSRPENTVLEVPNLVTHYNMDEEKDFGTYYPEFLCPAFSTGPLLAPQDAFTHVQEKILAWFDEVCHDPKYENPYFEVMPFPVEESSIETEESALQNPWSEHDQEQW